MTNYSRSYIPDYGEIVRPLYSLMNLKNAPKSSRKRSNGAVDGKMVLLQWSDEANESLRKLIKVMCSDLVLALPQFDFDFFVSCDASDHGYGAVLEQRFKDQMRSIAFFSRSYTTARLRKSS